MFLSSFGSSLGFLRPRRLPCRQTIRTSSRNCRASRLRGGTGAFGKARATTGQQAKSYLARGGGAGSSSSSSSSPLSGGSGKKKQPPHGLVSLAALDLAAGSSANDVGASAKSLVRRTENEYAPGSPEELKFRQEGPGGTRRMFPRVSQADFFNGLEKRVPTDIQKGEELGVERGTVFERNSVTGRF